MQTLLDPGLRPDSNPLPDVGHNPAQTTSPRRRRRDASGFTMNELLVVMIIIGVLGLLATGVYFAFIRTAEDTVLNANIQSAAEEVQSVVALNPGLAAPAKADHLITELSSRTNLIWDKVWDSGADDTAERVRFQTILQDSTAKAAGHTAATDPPEVPWLLDDKSAMRLHILDGDSGVWRCALIIFKPSTAGIKAAGAGGSYHKDDGKNAARGTPLATALTDATAARSAAEVRGVWYDGGSSQAHDGASTPMARGLHDCSPLGSVDPAGWLPYNAQTWAIAAQTAPELDNSSTKSPIPSSGTGGKRTLHRSPSSLDGE